MPNISLNKLVKKIRRKVDLTQEEFAKTLGVNVSTIIAAESGKQYLPKKNFLNSLASFLSISPELLLAQILYYDYHGPNQFFEWTQMHCISKFNLNNDPDWRSNEQDIINSYHNVEKEPYFSEITFAKLTAEMIINKWQLINNLVALRYNTEIGETICEGANDEVVHLSDNDYDFPIPHIPENTIQCYFSVLRKNHNPTKVTLIAVPNWFVTNSHHLTFEEISALSAKIVDKFTPMLNIDDRYNIKIIYILNSGNCNNKYEIMQEFKLTEKTSKDNFAFKFYSSNMGQYSLIDGEFYFEN